VITHTSGDGEFSVRQVATDNERWIMARTEQGAQGWFEMVRGAVMIGGARTSPIGLFDGLNNAD
jgi:hypothetical protein